MHSGRVVAAGSELDDAAVFAHSPPVFSSPPVAMSEDSRAGKPRKRFVVTNPGSESDDDRNNSRANANANARPPMSNAGPRNASYPNVNPASATQLKQNATQQPSLPTSQSAPAGLQAPVSPGSTGSQSTPPTTPNLHAPSSSVELENSSQTTYTFDAAPYPDRTQHDPLPPHTSAPRRPSKPLFHASYQKPFGGRPIGKPPPETYSRRLRTSPTSDPYGGPPPAADRVIFVTSDSERYVTVDLTGMKTAAQIRELILTKLNIYNEDEGHPYLIFQTEIGAYAIGDSLTDDHLVALCRDHGDSKGTLKFLVTHAFAPVQEPPPPSQHTEYNPIPTAYSQVTKPLRTKPRHASRSRNGSLSSASEKAATPEGLNGYEADLDYPEREAVTQLGRPSPSHLPSSPPKQTSLPPISPRRPNLGNHVRSSSPDQPISPPATSMNSRKDTHALPPIPMGAPPLSPSRPSFPPYEDGASALNFINEWRLHGRSGSDAAGDRELASRMASEQYFEHSTKQLRSHNHPSLQQLRSPASRDNMRQTQSRKTYDDEDPTQEITVPSNVRPTDELDRVSPTLARSSRRPQHSYTQRPTSPYTSRSHITQNAPSSRPQPSVPSVTKSRANLPISSNVLVHWKGEEGGRKPPLPPSSSNWQAGSTSRTLAKSMTKSMDNLRLTSPSSTRRNQVPPTPQLPITASRQNMRDGYSPSSSLGISGMPGMPKSYDTSPRFIRPLPVQGSPHGASPDIFQSSSSHYNGRGTYGSTLVSPSQEPYPRPLSAAGDTVSPTHRYPHLQSPTTYGPNLDTGEYNRSPRTVSPNRNYHSPGFIPGPRPRPTHTSNNSDRSSGPETSTSNTPPLTPASPHDAEASPPLSPNSVPDTIGTSGSDMTLKQDGQKYFASIIQTSTNGGTYIPPQAQQMSRPTRQLSPPPPLASSASSDAYGPDDDDDESDEGDGTWIVPPEPSRNAARPPLKVQIESSASTSSSRNGDISSNEKDSRPEPPPKDAPPSSYRPPAPAASNSSSNNALRAPQRPESTFVDPDSDNWAPRPPPENIYEELEKFFPKHDLDKPVIDATSGETSPTNAEPAAALPPPVPVNDDRTRIRAKKSIRIVAQEHKKRIDRTSKAADVISAKDNMMRKRSTKLWGSRLEEVTTLQGLQGRTNPPISAPDSPSGGPTTFKWVRGELIGKGTYGRVYLALNATTGEMIAVKQVELPQTASDKNDSRQHTVVQALKMESETLRDLDHPNIVQYLGFEETPANLSIFLEYVPGGSVGSCLHKHGKFADNVTRSFTSQILSGLEYLHSKGILHRDMKADNILVEMSGTCKISDFGISKRTEDLHGGAFTAMQGTVFWMAPEVVNAQKKGYNFKVDIWSVGCVVLEMWAGMRPWMGEEMVAVMFKLYQSKQPPPVPEDIVLSEEADDFRRKCFAINPEERPSAAELRKHPYLILPPGWVFTGFT